MEKILVSACLLGERVRYNGVSIFDDASLPPILRRWAAEGRLVPVCPEVAGGLGVPRPPAEIQGPGGGPAVLARLVPIHTKTGLDVTDAFLAGAQVALDTARRHGIRLAVLKENSPSCGSTRVHDGTFSGTKIPGMGTATTVLRAAGVEVFPETDLDAAAARLAEIEHA